MRPSPPKSWPPFNGLVGIMLGLVIPLDREFNSVALGKCVNGRSLFFE